jgi:nitroreductase
MDALTLLLQRNSAPRLDAPGPDRAALDQMIRCALRAPDHAWLHPTRFLLVEGDSRQRLGQLFADALRARKPAATADEIQKSLNAPLRAPVVIVVIAHVQQHPKVPALEQQLSAGCAAHGLLLAAQALGFGAVWRTGDNAYDPTVRTGLGLGAAEQIVGYVYVGTPAAAPKSLPPLDPADFVQHW